MAKFIKMKYIAKWHRDKSFYVYDEDLNNPYSQYFNVDTIERFTEVFTNSLTISYKKNPGVTTTKNITYFVINTISGMSFLMCPEEFHKLISKEEDVRV